MTDAALTERTKVSTNLKGMLAMAAAILTGGITAGVYAAQLIQRLTVLEAKVNELPTREDLRKASTKQQAAFVLCPGARSAWVKCRVIQGENEP